MRTTFRDIRYNCTRCQQPQTPLMIGNSPLWFCNHMECERFGVMTIMADTRSRENDSDEPSRPIRFTLTFNSVTQSKLKEFVYAVIALAKKADASGCEVQELTSGPTQAPDEPETGPNSAIQSEPEVSAKNRG